MITHSQAIKCFKTLRQYCQEHPSKNACKNCVFYHTYTIDDENYVYDECVLDGVRTLEHVYQREVLPVIEKNLEKLNEVAE